jgi:hypothetical protein
VRRSIFLAAAVLACDPTVGPGLALDMGHTCRAIDFEVQDPAVLPGWKIHAMAMERSGSEDAWTLATDPEGHLMLQPWPTGPGLELDAFGKRDEFTLMPGPIEGQAWLILDRENRTRVWRLDDAASGRVFAGPQIPQPDAYPRRRRLVFVDQTAYLLAVPKLADASLIEVDLAPLAADTLTPGPTTVFEFWRTCPEDQPVDVSCPTPLITGEIAVEPLGSSEPGTTSVSATLIAMYGSRQSETNTAVYPTLLTSLELLSAGPDQPPTMVRRDHVPWTAVDEVYVAPAQIAADGSGLFVLAGLTPALEGAAAPDYDYLIRASRNAGVQDNTIIAFFPKPLESQLLQLGGRVALLQRSVDRESLYIAPIGDVKVDTSQPGNLTLEPDAEVLLAGRGQLLVREATAARRVIAGCMAGTPADE